MASCSPRSRPTASCAPTTRSSSTRRTSGPSTSTSCWAISPSCCQAPGPQGRHHLRHHRPRALLPALRRRPDRRGQRADLSGGGALPPAPRRGLGRLRPRPDHRDLRRRRGTPGRGQGRHPRLPLRRTGDPRHRRRAEQEELPVHGSPPPLRPPLARRAAPRLPAAHRAQDRSGDERRRDLLTVPGIKYVIDPGFARISRYSHRTKVQRLPIEAISQASANQRKGRCGRTSDGICIRLYAEDDFLARPEFTDAEILRTNLASVILQMTAAGLGDIEKFPSSTRRTTATSATASSSSRSSARSTRPRRTHASASPTPAASSPSCPSTRAWRGWSWRPTRTAVSARSWS